MYSNLLKLHDGLHGMINTKMPSQISSQKYAAPGQSGAAKNTRRAVILLFFLPNCKNLVQGKKRTTKAGQQDEGAQPVHGAPFRPCFSECVHVG